MKMKAAVFLVPFAVISLRASYARAWGGRGHAAICETAVFLVKEPGLRDYLKNKPHMMGHLCNIPDFQWRSLPPEMTRIGNPTHSLDPELIGLSVPEIPLDFDKLVKTYTGKPNLFNKGATLFDVPGEVGSVWWRADQFYRRFLSFNYDLKKADAPKNRKEETDNNLPYNQAVYEMAVSLGLMGHFVGDAAQPLHVTADYDGYASGHGGLHAYYEDEALSEFDGDLQSQVLREARAMKNPPFLKPKTTLEKMKALSEASLADLKLIFKLDPVKKPSTVLNEKGMEIRKAAERDSAALGNRKFAKLILPELARASVLLAHLWDQAYIEAGRPRLVASKIYRYPTTVDFVAPDYLPKAEPGK